MTIRHLKDSKTIEEKAPEYASEWCRIGDLRWEGLSSMEMAPFIV